MKLEATFEFRVCIIFFPFGLLSLLSEFVSILQGPLTYHGHLWSLPISTENTDTIHGELLTVVKLSIIIVLLTQP